MAEVVSTLIKWLQTLPPDSKVFVDDGGLTLLCTEDADAYYELGGKPDYELEGEPDGEETN